MFPRGLGLRARLIPLRGRLAARRARRRRALCGGGSAIRVAVARGGRVHVRVTACGGAVG